MSVTPSAQRRLSVPAFVAKKGREKLVVLTAYTAPQARLLDGHVDALLVGDSLGMVLYGMESTLPVTLDLMISHAAAVVRASAHALVIVDLPFGSYQASPAQAFHAASRALKETGAAAVKLEGGEEMAETVEFLHKRAIPMMGHIGLKPQHVHVMGGYRYQGRTEAEREALLRDAKALEKAGAFALLLEGMESTVAAEITKQARIPTIGIGAGAACDGQVLVSEDMMGLHATTPRFVRRFGDLAAVMENAARDYAQAVRSGSFPDKAESYGEN